MFPHTYLEWFDVSRGKWLVIGYAYNPTLHDEMERHGEELAADGDAYRITRASHLRDGLPETLRTWNAEATYAYFTAGGDDK